MEIYNLGSNKFKVFYTDEVQWVIMFNFVVLIDLLPLEVNQDGKGTNNTSCEECGGDEDAWPRIQRGHTKDIHIIIKCSFVPCLQETEKGQK